MLNEKVLHENGYDAGSYCHFSQGVCGGLFYNRRQKAIKNKWLLSNGCEFASCDIFFFKVEKVYKILFHTSQRAYLYKGMYFAGQYQQSLKTKKKSGENNHGRIHDF